MTRSRVRCTRAPVRGMQHQLPCGMLRGRRFERRVRHRRACGGDHAAGDHGFPVTLAFVHKGGWQQFGPPDVSAQKWRRAPGGPPNSPPACLGRGSRLLGPRPATQRSGKYTSRVAARSQELARRSTTGTLDPEAQRPIRLIKPGSASCPCGPPRWMKTEGRSATPQGGGSGWRRSRPNSTVLQAWSGRNS